MFWKRKEPDYMRQRPIKMHVPADGRMHAIVAERLYPDSRRKQMAHWFATMERITGSRPRQMDAAEAFRLTQGRISQLMH